MFRKVYDHVFEGDERWEKIGGGAASQTYDWDDASTYARLPPYFDNMSQDLEALRDIEGARILALLGDSITTDHISPAGAIAKGSPAAQYLIDHGVEPKDFNSYGARRGNHEVMMRGTLANIRLQNEMVDGKSGGWTKLQPDGDLMTIYHAAMAYKERGVPLVIVGGREYGSGSSRDWAAKGVMLLGVKAVIVESFERIHRSNLIGMGVLPLVFEEGTSWKSLGLDGSEVVTIAGISAGLRPGARLEAEIRFASGEVKLVPLICRIDTLDELEYFNNGGILHYVLRRLAA
jgi:aconitate hydratase